MKKRLAVMLSVVLMMALLPGCGGGQKAPAQGGSSGAAGQAGADTQAGKSQATQMDWPKQNITVVIGYAPGGGSDVMLSAVRPGLEKVLKTTLVPVYKPGSGSDLALTEVAKAKPDGYTMVVTTTPQVFINPVVRQTQYKFSDFVFVANVITDPGILVVRAEHPFKTLDDLIKAAKEQPGKVTVGVSSAPSDDWFAGIMLEQAAGIDLNLVVFSGDGPSWQAALGGQIDVSANNLGIVYPQIKAGKLRALAIMSEQRSPYLPDVPTMRELGYDIVSGSSRGFAMPKDTPKEIVETFANAVKQVMESEEFKTMAQETAFPANYLGQEEFTAFLQKQEAIYRDLWEKFGKEATAQSQ